MQPWRWVLLASIILSALWGGTPAQAQQDDTYVIPEFTFENGQKLTDMKVGYAQYGTLNADKDNMILVTHGTSGGRGSSAIFIGPGKAIDTNKYFVIAVDAIGGGLSSSPKDGLGVAFPRYTIRDMVRAQYELVTKKFGVTKLVAVGGPSMGSFQALEWGINYPDAMKGLLLIVPGAKAPGSFRMACDAMFAAIKGDPKWQDGKYAENPTEGLRTAAQIFGPWVVSEEYLDTLKTPEEYQNVLNAFVKPYTSWDAVNWIWRYTASYNHDVSQPFGGDMRAALGKIKAKGLVLPSATDRTLPKSGAQEIYRGIKDSVYVEIPSLLGHSANNAGNEQAPENVFITLQLRTFLAGL